MRDHDLIGSGEVAEILDVDTSTVTRQANAGRIPAVKKANGLRGPWLFDRSVIERIAEERAS